MSSSPLSSSTLRPENAKSIWNRGSYRLRHSKDAEHQTMNEQRLARNDCTQTSTPPLWSCDYKDRATKSTSQARILSSLPVNRCYMNQRTKMAQKDLTVPFFRDCWPRFALPLPLESPLGMVVFANQTLFTFFPMCYFKTQNVFFRILLLFLAIKQ